MLILLCACAGAPVVSDDTASSDSAVPVDTEDTAITEDTGEPGRFLVDEDGDGFAVAGGDCDDTDPTRRVGLLDLPCDGIDQDCDGTVDESSECGDDDGDGTTDLEGDCHDGEEKHQQHGEFYFHPMQLIFKFQHRTKPNGFPKTKEGSPGSPL